MAPTDKLKARLQKGLKGNRKAIIRLFKVNPEAFGDTQPMAAIAKAKEIVRVGAIKYSMPSTEQERYDAAETFLAKLAKAITYVPAHIRMKAMLKYYVDLLAHLEKARPIIMATPRSDRGRADTVKHLALRTKLAPKVVAEFHRQPTTRALGLARRLTGEKFSVDPDHVRKMHAKYARKFNISPKFLVMNATKKVK